LKIVHIIYDDLKNPWCGGGGARRVFEIYKRLADKHKISVITGNFPDAENENINGIEYIRVGMNMNYWLSRISFSIKIPFVVKNMEFDLLVNDFSLFSPCFADFYTKKPVINVVHHIVGAHALRKYPVIGLKPYLAERFNLKYSKNVISVSESVLNKIKRFNRKKKLVCIHNGIDEKYFNIEGKEGDFLLFLGRIDIYMKGLDILLKSFREIVKEFDGKYKLIIAGRGKEKDFIRLNRIAEESGIKKYVEITGEVTESKKLELLANCLFLCMPSRFEGWGITAIEAAAAGKPVVGTKIDGLTDAVIDGATGILVEPESCKEFSRGMISMLKDEGLRKKSGKKAREWAKKFDWDEIAVKQEKFYKEILENI